MRQSRTLFAYGKRIAGNSTAYPNVVQLVLRARRQAAITLRLSLVSQLSEGHTEVMVETGKLLDLEVAIVAIYVSMKNMEQKMLHTLRENELAGVQDLPLRTVLYEDDRPSGHFKVVKWHDVDFSQY
jgi:hypothetical protein